MTSVAIVDYGLCNLDSIRRATEECGGQVRVTDKPDDLADAERIILPGVGSFAKAMENLRARGFAAALTEAVKTRRVPLLGICLGMHLLGEEGTEGGPCPGLGLLRGRITRLEPANGAGTERVPHIGWNDVHPAGVSPLFDGVAPGTDFYFVHGYRLESPAEETLGTVDYCGQTVAAAGNAHVMAVQFHPEKSQTAGFQVLKNFLIS